MSISYAQAVIADRLTALTRALDAGGAGGRVLLFAGTRPTAGAAATGALATFTLPWPCLDNVTGSTLTIKAPAPAMVQTSGEVTWVRMTDSTGAWVLDCDAAGLVSGPVQAGGELTLAALTLSEV